MPEGDSLHNLASRLAPVLVKREVKSFTARRISDDVGRSLVGKSVVDVSARGKNLLVRFDDGRVLHIHLKMDGRVFVQKPRSAFWAPRVESSQPDLRIVMSSGAVIVGSRLPVCRVLSPMQEKHAPDLQSLGPDLCLTSFLTDDTLQDDAIKRLRGLHDQSIAEALLVQRGAAGIGNVYKSEVLFLERVDPRARVSTLDDATLRRLLLRASVLLQRNLTSGPRTTRPTLAGPRLWVYERRDKPCLRCKEAIIDMYREITVRDGAAQSSPRSTYFCPKCQDGVHESPRSSS